MGFLFGDILAISQADLYWLFLGGAAAIAALVSVWRPLLSLSVHEDIAAAEGRPTERVRLVFVLVLALVVAISIKIVGALLTIAFLIMPAAAARPLARTPEQMAVLAGVFGMLAVAAGLLPVGHPGTPSRPVHRAGAGGAVRGVDLSLAPAPRPLSRLCQRVNAWDAARLRLCSRS